MYYLENIINLQDSSGVRLTVSYQPENWNSNRISTMDSKQLKAAEKLCKNALDQIRSMMESK